MEFDNVRISQLMQVTRITATCSTNEAAIKREMHLIDRASFGTYGQAMSLTMPAIEGVGTGDVLKVEVSFEHNAIEDELLRQVTLDARGSV